MADTPTVTESAKKKTKKKKADARSAFVIDSPSADAAGGGGSAASPRSASYDLSSSSGGISMSIGDKSPARQLDKLGSSLDGGIGGNRFMSTLAPGAGGYGATLTTDPFYHGEDDTESDALLRPAASSSSAKWQSSSSSAAAATASPVGQSAQDVLARLMAAQNAQESRKNVVGGIAGDKDGSEKGTFCQLNVIAGLILVVVLSSGAVLGIIFYSRLAGGGGSDVEVVTKTDKPHIVFLLADDLGWNSIGYEDFDLSFATPFLTGLAKQGIIMDSYYAQEVCTPARAAILTGRYPLTTGMQFSMIMPTTSWGLDLNETTLAEILKEDGYKTHLLGKWHLGHYSPRYLPTARGFDSFLGYLSGENYYWSKKNPDHTNFVDMITSDTSCYSPYMEEDLHDYSTFLYRDKAVAIIEEHDEVDPLFLYVAFQAVHDPFNDFNHHSKGLPKEYLKDGVYEQIGENVVGHKRRQYTMALSVMDDAVSDIYESLEAKGMLDQTYIIFSSDNGGCYLSGGKNGPLRGSKGSLFEGGLKVDAFIYSPSESFIPTSKRGQLYPNLMHATDWFPTILQLAGVDYTPAGGHELDGFSHVDAWMGRSESAPREYMLYNYYYQVTDYYFDKWTNGSFAIRNGQYKLMHTFDSTAYGAWWDGEDTLDNDDSLAESSCSQASAMTGEYTYYLFDLISDPYETTNLYHEDGTDYHSAKIDLYAKLDEYQANVRAITANVEARNKITPVIWKKHHDYIVPWVSRDDLDEYAGAFPEDCYVAPTAAPTHSPDWTPDPTHTPTEAPTNTVAPTPTEEFVAEPSPAPSTRTPTTLSPTTAKPSNSPTGGSPDSTPTWFFPTVDTPTMGVPTIGMPTIGQPSLIDEPTCSGCPTTLPIVLDGPTWSPTFGTPSTDTTPTTVSVPSTPTWNWPTWAPVAPSETPSATPTTLAPTTLEPTPEPTEEPTEKPSAEPTKRNDDDWYTDDKFAPTHSPTEAVDDWTDDSRRRLRQ